MSKMYKLKDFRQWMLDGKLHRENGPAIIWNYGTQEWYLNNKMHREGGPAYICPSNYKSWYLNGVLHREDGPAITDERYKHWYFKGLLHDQKEWLNIVLDSRVINQDA